MNIDRNHQDVIAAELRRLAAEIIHADPGEMEDGRPLGEYGITSIELIDFVRRIERTYSIRFQPETLKEITLGAIARNVHEAVGGPR